MMRYASAAIVLLLFASGGCAASSGVSSAVSVDRLDVLLTLLADGSLEVQETLSVRFSVPASTSFVRRLPRAGHDGITQVRAYLDDRLVGDQAGADATWTFPAIASGTRLLRLRYRAAATLAVSGGRGRFAWPVLEGGRDWPVTEARVVLIAPAGSAVLIPVAVAEPGWRVSERPDGGVAEKSGVEVSESANVSVEIGITPRSLAEPTWQFEAERAEKLVPAFVIAALFILVAGVGALVMVGVLSPKSRGDEERAVSVASLRKAGGVLLVLGAGLTWVVRDTLDAFGPWAMVVPVSVAVVGLLFLVAAPGLKPRPPES